MEFCLKWANRILIKCTWIKKDFNPLIHYKLFNEIKAVWILETLMALLNFDLFADKRL